MSEKREIKTTLAIDGEKQFKAAMDEAYRGMKVLGSEMKLNTAVFGDNASSMEGLTKKGEILGKQISQQKEIVAALSKAVQDSAAAYGENDKRTDAYRIKLNNATAALNKMEGELSTNKGAIDNFGKETEKTGKKTRNWGETLKKVNDALGKATVVAAKAAATAMAAVGAAAVAAGKSLFDAAKGTGVFADDLITLSQQTRISTDTLQKWSYASRFVDVEVETMTGSMAKMIRNMDSARDGTGASAEAFKQLGVSVTDSNGQLLDSEQVFMATIDALGKVGNETERDAIAMAIFGKSAQELNPLINAGSQALQTLGQEAADAGLVMSDAALAQAGAFDDARQKMDAQMEGVKRSVGMVFMPAMQEMLTGTQQVMSSMTVALKDGFQPEDVATIGQSIAQKLTEGMQRLTEYLPQIISTVTQVLSQLMTFAVTYLPTLLPQLMKAAVALLTGALQAIKDNIQKIAETVKVLIKSFVQFMTSNLPDIIKVAIEIVLALIEGFVSAIPDLVASLPQIITAIVGGLLEGIPKLFDVGVQMIKGIWEGIKSMATWFWEKLKEWFSDALGWIGGLLGIHSPSTVMADMIGRPMGQGVAAGILSAKKDVERALAGIIPSAQSSAINLRAKVSAYEAFGASAIRYAAPRVDESGRGVVALSDAAVAQIAHALKSAFAEQGDTVLVLNDRELGRYVRGVSFA